MIHLVLLGPFEIGRFIRSVLQNRDDARARVIKDFANDSNNEVVKLLRSFSLNVPDAIKLWFYILLI